MNLFGRAPEPVDPDAAALAAYREGFAEEPGYLDFASMGPVGTAVLQESAALMETLATLRFGTQHAFEEEQADRVSGAIARAVRLPERNVVFQPNTSQGLMHVMFGLTGTVALSSREFPTLPFSVTRAEHALRVLTPRWLDVPGLDDPEGEAPRAIGSGVVGPQHGLTPALLREQLDDSVTAVAVSLVDYRTGFVVDLEGIRQVIGDRMLIVDAIQGFGVVDAPWELADVVATGGQKWVRAGWGTGFLALSDRALEQLDPVFSGFTGSEVDGLPIDEVPPPADSARRFSVSNGDPVAKARFAAALETIERTGVDVIGRAIAQHVSRVIDLADEAAIPVVSPRDERERAGIVVLEPAPDQLTTLVASLMNHGVTHTERQGRVRLAPHASTTEETFEMLRAAFVSFGSATPV